MKSKKFQKLSDYRSSCLVPRLWHGNGDGVSESCATSSWICICAPALSMFPSLSILCRTNLREGEGTTTDEDEDEDEDGKKCSRIEEMSNSWRAKGICVKNLATSPLYFKRSSVIKSHDRYVVRAKTTATRQINNSTLQLFLFYNI